MAMDVGGRIKERREHLGWTQADLAKKAGIRRATLANYETNRRQPDLETLQRLAHALNTSISYLAGETDDPSPLPSMGVAAHREGSDPGDPLDPEVQLIMERAFREISRKLEEKWKQRQQGDSRGGEASPNGRH